MPFVGRRAPCRAGRAGLPRSGSPRRAFDRQALGLETHPEPAVSGVGAHPACLGLACRRPYSVRGATLAMIDRDHRAPQPPLSLLEYLQQHGWKIVRDNGREEVAGLCPLHRDSRPSFYVNRRKQLFYCHGCGRGGGLARLIRWLQPAEASTPDLPAEEQLLEHVYDFYRRQLARSNSARAYLTMRGIHDQAVIE